MFVFIIIGAIKHVAVATINIKSSNNRIPKISINQF
jgi:hypothetical protein